MATPTVIADPVSAAGKHAIGDLYLVLATFAFDNSYPTGGEVVTAANFGLDLRIDAIVPISVGGNRILEFDRTNSKIKLFTALGTEAANASDQSTITATVLVIGE